uniref:tetratricopeptide repeat protein n=1 Tax=Alistipes putredinis TaxID=28117 RepID=UPI003FD80E69
MRKNLNLLLAFAVCALCASGAQAGTPESAAFIDRGRSLFDFGRWTDARHEFLQARETLSPADREAAQTVDFYLAACAVELGSRDAEAALRRFEARYPGSVYANDVRFSLGSYYCAEGDMKRAREAFEKTDYKALGRARKEQYDVRMGYVEFTDGDYDKAFGYFDRIGPQSEYADHALYYKSYIDYAEGRYGRAKQGLTALQRSDAYRDVVPYYLLQIEFHEGNYRYVVENGGKLVQRAVPERRKELERVIAESWFRLGDFNKTIEHLDAFAAAGGELDRDGSYLMGFSLYRTARYAEAAEWLRKACGAEDALTQNASYHLADCYLRGGDKQQAMQSFAMASNAEFDSAIAEDALFNYGKLQYELGGGRFNEAIQVLNRYVAQYPSSPRVRTAKELLAAAYYNSHNYDEAYEIIASYPDPDGDLLAAKQKIAYFRGLSALEKGDTEGAGRYLAESARIGISPKYNALATFWQGEIAYGRGNYDVALRDYESYLKRAPKTEPEYAMAFYNTGYCHFSKENMPRARESFVRFIELYPTQDGYRTDARNRLGDTYYSDRQFDEALKYYGQAAAASDDGADYARYQRAVTLGILGRTSEKIKALQQIIRDGRGDYLDDATYELGRTFVAQERYREGAAVLEPFVETYVYSPYRSAALSELGLAYLNLGDKKKSLSYYDMVVKTAPQSSDAKDALQGIRDIYVSEGDAGGYFDYARKSGVEGDLTAMSRDSLSFAAARRIYLSGEPASAAKSLRSYLESYPKGYYTADALYCLSDCYLKTGERSRAIETLAALAGAGQNQYTHRALKTLAGMTFADERFTEAAAAYRKLADAESTAAGKAEAMNGYVRATIAAGDEERILSMADDVASYTAAGDQAWRESQFAKAGILDRRGDAAAAQKIYKVLSANVKTPEGAESAYRVIESAFRAGDTARAEKLVLDFSDKGTPHAFWLAKSFLVLGDIYVQKGDMFQARATYQSIVDGYTPADDGIVAEAKEKIKKLN